jgi:hypothetical protein
VDAFRTWCATNTVKQPETAFLYAEGLATAALGDERVDVVEFQPVAVDLQERGCHGHRDTFVSIHERMVLREALPESGSFLNRVAIPDAPGASETCDQLRVNGNCLFD